jgi:hypothetical protein
MDAVASWFISLTEQRRKNKGRCQRQQTLVSRGRTSFSTVIIREEQLL